MILPKPKDALHRAWLLRTLGAIYDDAYLANVLIFKGGTCAALRGYLDRFSVDLDFDCKIKNNEILIVKKRLERIFSDLGLEIKDQSNNVPQYFLRYPTKEGERNTIKIDITFPPAKNNVYEMARIPEIERIARCQTIETMFANKLVALVDRFDKNGSIAGRDIYDIHYFFSQGFRYNKEVIVERRKTTVENFLIDLIGFIEKRITLTVIDQDLNMLLGNKQFQSARKHLKTEVLMFLKNELENIKNIND